MTPGLQVNPNVLVVISLGLLTSGKNLLQIHGLSKQFLLSMPSNSPGNLATVSGKCQYPRASLKYSSKLQAIQHLFDIKAIKVVPIAKRAKNIYSVFFLVLKNGEMQTILDLKW